MEYTRESIFVSAVRSFCKSFATLFGILVAIFLISLSSKGTEMVLLPDADGKHEMLPSSAPVILQITIHGIIGIDDITGTAIEKILMDSQEGFFSDHRVKAILLHMDTPGGVVDDADSIYRQLMEYKKKYSIPIYAYVEGINASGGVYICSAADKIYSTGSSIIGSVGVIMGPMFNFTGAMDKFGIQADTLTAGKDKDEFNPFRVWVPGEGDSIRDIVGALYERFRRALRRLCSP